MRSKSIGLVALVTLAAIVPLTMADHDTYNDQFADGELSWRTTGSADWQVVNGQRGGILWGDNSGNNSTDSLAYNGRGWADYRYTIELYRIGDVSLDPAIGVAWRHDRVDGYYSLSLRDGAYAFGVPNLTGGTTVGSYTNHSSLDVDRWNEVIIRTQGDVHTFILNGIKVGNLTDNTSAAGNIGVTLAPGAEAVFDNAYVTTLLEPRLDTTPPSVDITTSPDLPNGKLLVAGDVVTLTVTASDDANDNGTLEANESGIFRIRAYIDGNLAATKAGTSATSYVLSVDVSRASFGDHRITVMAEDKAHLRAFDGLAIFVVNHCLSVGPGTPTCVP